jgi:hypothetical protein
MKFILKVMNFGGFDAGLSRNVSDALLKKSRVRASLLTSPLVEGLTGTRLSGKAELTGICPAISPQETVRSAIRGYGEVLLSIGIRRGVGSMARRGVRQYRRADDKDWRL